MDEDAYRSTYQQITSIPCVYEKAQCSLHCGCSKGEMFRLADRHGVACQSAEHKKNCQQLLDHLRQQTRFVFKLSEIDGPLPHNKEIRVQNGGLNGLRLLFDMAEDQSIDISQLISRAIEQYGSVERLPYDLIMQSVMAYKSRPKRRGKK